jgi:hypothetical protein
VLATEAPENGAVGATACLFPPQSMTGSVTSDSKSFWIPIWPALREQNPRKYLYKKMRKPLDSAGQRDTNV